MRREYSVIFRANYDKLLFQVFATQLHVIVNYKTINSSCQVILQVLNYLDSQITKLKHVVKNIAPANSTPIKTGKKTLFLARTSYASFDHICLTKILMEQGGITYLLVHCQVDLAEERT